MATIFEKLQAQADPVARTDEWVRDLKYDGLVDESERAHNRTLYFLDDGTCLIVWDRGYAEHVQNDPYTLEEICLAAWNLRDGSWIKE